MAIQTTAQIRIEKNKKEAASKIFNDLGMDFSTGVKIYLNQVIRNKGIPFSLDTADDLPIIAKKNLIKEHEQALVSGKRYKTIKEAHGDILSS